MSTVTPCATTPGLSVSIRFITGRCVATKVSSREQSEWPLHPGRIFMAMAAAFFEAEGTDEEKQCERDALNWITTLDPPALRHAPHADRSAYTCYVPVNDNPKPNKAMLQSAPGLPRSRQPRMFPTVIPEGELHVQLCWDCGDVPAEHFAAIDRICRNVIRIGHSSSLVMMWAEDFIPATTGDGWMQPTDGAASENVRIAAVGELDRLEAACGADRIEAFAALAQRITESNGKEKSAAKAEFEQQFGEAYKASLRPPEPMPPTISNWQGYTVSTAMPDEEITNSYFDRELIIFRTDGPKLSVERCLSLTRALRNKAMAACPIQPPPEWLSGHANDGSPSSTPHAAYLPLPFAGTKWADGHIMGLAIAMPKGVSLEQRGRALGPLMIDQSSGETVAVPFRLWGSETPDFEVKLCQEPCPPVTLSNATWTTSARVWNSVTPVVLDRFPKPAKSDNRSKWLDDVRRIIAKSCERAGLPIPIHINVNTTAFVKGIPRAVTKQRRARRDQTASSSLGDGFSAFGRSKDQAPRPQLHVQLEFEQRVAGPVIIGAGRFAGYGLCLPARFDDAKRSQSH